MIRLDGETFQTLKWMIRSRFDILIKILIIIQIINLSCAVDDQEFIEDFDNLNNWEKYGTPSPHIVSSVHSKVGVLDINGAPTCESNIISERSFSFSNGFIMESQIFLDTANSQAAFVAGEIGLAKDDSPITDAGCQKFSKGLTLGIVAGNPCAGVDCSRPESNIGAEIQAAIYTDDQTWEKKQLDISGVLNGWHTLKIVVDGNRYVKFYVDSSLKLSFSKRINSEMMNGGKKALIGGMSDTVGKCYFDYINIIPKKYNIRGAVKVQDGNTYIDADFIPVYIWQKDVSSPIWGGITQNGNYDSGDLRQRIIQSKPKEFYVEAKWENQYVGIYDGWEVNGKLIQERYPLQGYLAIPDDNMWNDIVFRDDVIWDDDDDASRDYSHANTIFSAITQMGEYVKNNWDKNFHRVKVYIHDTSSPDTQTNPITGNIRFQNKDDNYNPYTAVHEYGHALHFQYVSAFSTYPRDMREAWAIYFESFSSGDFSTALEDDFTFCNVPHQLWFENLLGHYNGQVYAGVIFDLKDGGTGDDDDFNGPANQGEKRIFDAFMKDKVKSIDEFYDEFVKSDNEKEILNYIYARHGLISPRLKNSGDISIISPKYDEDLNIYKGDEMDYHASVTNRNNYPLSYEIQQFVLPIDNFDNNRIIISKDVQCRNDLYHLGAFQQIDEFWGWSPNLAEGRYRIRTALTPRFYENTFDDDGTRRICSGSDYYIDSVDQDLIVIKKGMAIVTNSPVDISVVGPGGEPLSEKGQNTISNMDEARGEWHSNNNILLISNLESGYYRISAIPRADAGKDVTLNLTVYSNRSDIMLADRIPLSQVHDGQFVIEVVNGEIVQPLSVQKAANLPEVPPGAKINFLIKVSNEGSARIEDIDIADYFPVDLKYISDDREGKHLGGSIYWDNIGALDPKETVTINATFLMNETPAGYLNNIVMATGVSTLGQREVMISFANASAKILHPKISISLGLSEPVQYGQFCENKKVIGTGKIDVSVSMIDRMLSMQYCNSMAGDGDIELESENALSEKSSKLQRSIGNNTTSPLNLYETFRATYNGKMPLTSEKSLQSNTLYGGIGAEIEESFSAKEMEREQQTFFASTDPATQVTDQRMASRLRNTSSTHILGMHTKNAFNGTWGTTATWQKLLYKDIVASERLVGTFEVEKTLKFHENPIPAVKQVACEGLDC